jgi:cell division protein FtsQ
MKIFLHRENKKSGKQSGRLRLRLWSAVLVLLCSLVFLYVDRVRVAQAAVRLRNFFLDHPYFSVQEIQVRGGEKIGGSEIVAMAGLSHGMSIWKIDAEGIERKVGRHPWVKHVLLRREFPHRVVIEVEERSPKAVVIMGKLYYVDAEGFVFKEVGEGERADFPLLTGLRQAELVARAYSTRQRIQEALRLSDLMGRSSLQPSEIHFNSGGGIVLYPMAYSIALHFGWGDWEDKVKRLRRVLEVWNGRENRLAALDLRFRDQVVARMRKEEGARRKAAS